MRRRFVFVVLSDLVVFLLILPFQRYAFYVINRSNSILVLSLVLLINLAFLAFVLWSMRVHISFFQKLANRIVDRLSKASKNKKAGGEARL